MFGLVRFKFNNRETNLTEDEFNKISEDWYARKIGEDSANGAHKQVN